MLKGFIRNIIWSVYPCWASAFIYLAVNDYKGYAICIVPLIVLYKLVYDETN